MMETEYRLYTFTNMYISQIQRGIQSAHLVHELFNKYPRPLDTTAKWSPWDVLNDWSRSHKTMIVLNGGRSLNLAEIFLAFKKYEYLDLPYAQFREPDIDDALTCVGIVLPSEIYDYDPAIELEPIESFTPGYVIDLYNLIKGYPLA